MSPDQDTKKLYMEIMFPKRSRNFRSQQQRIFNYLPYKVSQFISVMYWRKPIESKK